MIAINLPNGDSMHAKDFAGIRCYKRRTVPGLGTESEPSIQIQHLTGGHTCISLPTNAHAQMWHAILNAVWQGRVTL